jgi:hypothetical protein
VCTARTNGIDAASIAAMHIKISRDRKPVIVLAAVKGKALSRRQKWPPLTAAARDGAAILCRNGGMVRVLTEQRNECQQQPENHRFDFAIAAVAGTGRLNAPRWRLSERGEARSSIKTGQGIGLSDDASSQGRTPWMRLN